MPVKVLVATLILAVSLLPVAAQTEYAPHLLIPYNDHGQWGYCDTLGQLIIAPAFAEAEFFSAYIMGTTRQSAAKVQTQYGQNYASATGQLLFPPGGDVGNRVRLSPAKGRGYLVTEEGQIGIYNPQSGWHTPPVYDTVSYLAEQYGLLLMKADSASTFVQIDNYTGTATPTDIVHLAEYLHRGSVSLLANTADGRYFELINGILFPRSAEALQAYTRLEAGLVEEVPEPPFPVRARHQWSGPDPDPSSFQLDSIVDKRDFAQLSISKKYGFQQLFIGLRQDQQGVVNEAGEVILPFQYDKIEFSNDGTQAHLWQNGKQGYKLFLCPYPTIEPSYDQLAFKTMLRVKPSWQFAIFEIILDEQRAYLGENGVPYFDFE